MSFLLNIDTATEYASVCLSKNAEVIAMEESEDQKNHASFVHPAIQRLSEISGCRLNNIDAIAVTYGPGSYTGLRVGLATAKGLCYALNKPLLLINTLEVIAQAAIEAIQNSGLKIGNDKPAATNTVFCPMIDARRMEVFTAIYSKDMQALTAPAAITLTEQSFIDILQNNRIVFSGSGHHKLEKLIQHSNALFLKKHHTSLHLSYLSYKAFSKKQFANLAYSEPFYLKEVFTFSHIH